MRVGFAGTPEFAARALAAILESGHTIPLCLTQPDRPRGRGLRTEASPVKALASRHGIAVAQPHSLKDAAARAPIVSIAVDVLVVAAYGLILPQAVLEWPRHGCLNIHASRLPRWRGAAPIQRAIEAGDTTSGVTIMRMDAGLDTGPIVDMVEVAVAPRETGGTLEDKLAAAGARAIVVALEQVAHEGRIAATPQPADGVTYASKITREETVVDWSLPASAIERRLRAFDPAPGNVATLGGETIKLWSGEVMARVANAAPGTIVAAGPEGIDVAAGGLGAAEALRILELQPAGGKRMRGAAFVAGRRVAPGMAFAARHA